MPICPDCNQEKRLIRGYCARCGTQRRRDGRLDPLTDEDRFWRSVDKDGPMFAVRGTPCWDWTRSGVRGYGRLLWGGVRTLAHRVSWALAHGTQPPPDMEVMHLCQRPSCVNPDHLELGTHEQNMEYEATTGRSVGRVPRGMDHVVAKLTDEQVVDLRLRVRRGETFASIGRALGVEYQTVAAIAKGRSWKHLGGPVLGRDYQRGAAK